MADFNITGSGGVEAEGASETLAIYEFESSGGVLAAGNSLVVKDINIEGLDGILVDGSGSVVKNIVFSGSGGVLGNGSSLVQTNYNFSGSGGVLAAGNTSAVKNIIFSGSGGALADGSSSVQMIYNPLTSGGVLVSGNSIDKILIISTASIPILFNLGDLPVYAYRVLGECSKLDCTNIPFQDASNNCGNQVINYILARDIADVCRQLSSYDFVFKIKAVYKYNRAIFGFDYLNDVRNNLVDPTCPNFEDVTEDFCIQADCFDFCADLNTMALVNGIFSADVYRPNNSYGNIRLTGGYTITNASGYTFSASGGINLTGNAATSGTNLIPVVAFSGGGSISLSGSADNNNSYLGEFTVTVGGGLDVDAFTVNINGQNGLQLQGQIVNSVANICGCLTLMNYVQFESNLLTKSSLLSDFIYRNNLTFDKTIRLYYNQATKAFYNSIKYEGIGLSSNDYEEWNIVPELACTNQLSLTGDYLWNFSIFVSRKLYSNNILKNNLETRFYVYIPSSLIYDSISLLEFDFEVDIKNLVVYNKFKEIIFNLEPRILKDNTKIFSSGSWITDPYLNLFVYSVETNLPQIFRPNKNSEKINVLPLVEFP